MKVSQLLGARFKETPADCQTASHAFMVRGGYVKNVGNGIFSLYMPAKRIAEKIEHIIRQEMDHIDGQEVLFPVAMPAALWKESGRYEAVGSELLRFKDRSGADMVLGMTHEEAAVHLARDAARSYADYPFMIYQIQTKFRDEPRARAGLIRVREFTMKDAYSFHTTQEDLEQYYDRCYRAYERIFARAGVPEVISVKSDSGMMGGKVAHEFMLVTDIGEDSLALCDHCDFRANLEAAECVTKNTAAEDQPLTRVPTPNIKTIEDLCAFFATAAEKLCKAVVYQTAASERVVVFIRGDLEVNEIKLRNFLRAEIYPAAEEDCGGLCCGFIGPVGLKAEAKVLFDRSLRGAHALICGANERDAHYTGFTPGRDLAPDIEYHDLAKTYAGAVCPACGQPSIAIRRGIEVGNIFQLGTKYTTSMGMQYVDKDGALQYPMMGCYGIGVGRLMASVCEVRRDEYGPIWPMSIAPWQVHICAIRSDNAEVAEAANTLYGALQAAGTEVIFDDRPVSAGVMFSDADLLGVPVRAVISPKTCARGAVEISLRDKSLSGDVASAEAADYIDHLVKEQLARYI